MIIVGGTYSEICFEPIWENIFGSGFRAVNLLLESDYAQEIHFYTCCDEETKQHLEYYTNLNSRLKLFPTNIFESPIFHYDHPLQVPSITPRLDLYKNINLTLHAKGENLLVYGLLEAEIKVEGKKVVYDPQSPVNPKSFSSSGSKAEELIIIINLTEARILTKKKDIKDIKDFFFNTEKCKALVIKMGAKGALLFQDANKDPDKIPVYKTEQVWSIGSGDVFSAYFAYSWFTGKSLLESATNASEATALYCNSKDLAIFESLKTFSFDQLLIDKIPTEKVYLAGPFFTFAERWLVNEAYNALKGFGLNIFSPFHHVGHGKAEDVVHKDLKGLDESQVVFAIVDGLDSGTLFEVGYAIAQKKKVIAFVQNENEESLKMLEGSHCTIERDFTSAVYKTFWSLAK